MASASTERIERRLKRYSEKRLAAMRGEPHLHVPVWQAEAAFLWQPVRQPSRWRRRTRDHRTRKGRAAMGDRVALEEPGLGLHLITSLADGDRIAQQHRRFGRGHTRYLVFGLGGSQVAVDGRRRHRQQLRTHTRAVTVHSGNKFAVPLQRIELHAHRYHEVLAALPTRGRPHLLQHLQRVVGVLRRARGALTHRHRVPRARRQPRGSSQPPPRVVARPTGHLHHLIEDPAPVLLRRLHILPREPAGHLGPRPHRQPTSHPPTITISRANLCEAPRAFRGQIT